MIVNLVRFGIDTEMSVWACLGMGGVEIISIGLIEVGRPTLNVWVAPSHELGSGPNQKCTAIRCFPLPV